MESYTRADDWSAPAAAPRPNRSHHRPDAARRLGVRHPEHGERDVLESEPEHDLPERQLQQQLARVSYSLSYSMNKNTQDSDEDGNEVTNDNQFSLSVSRCRWTAGCITPGPPTT